MKKLIFTLCLLQSFVFAQNIKLTWSPEIEIKKKTSIGDIIYTDSKGIYYTTFERKGGMYSYYKSSKFKTIDKISATNLTPISSKEVSAFDDYDFRGIRGSKGNLLLFASKYDKKAEGTKYYVGNIDLNLNTNGSAKEFLSVTEEDFSKAADLTIRRSYDSSKFLVLAERGSSASRGYKALREYNKNKKEDMKMIVIVLDSKGTKVWQKTIEIPENTDGAISIAQEAITPNGDVFLLIKEFNNKKMKATIKDENGKKIPGYKYRLLRIYNNGNATQSYAIELGDKYINSADMKVNKSNNNLICSGFYNDQDNEVLKGLFYFEIDNTGTIIKKNSKDFPQDFVEEFKKHNGVKKDKKNNDSDDDGLDKGFTVDDILIREDGGSYLLAEYYFSRTVCYTTSSGSTSCKTYYYHYDILTVNITADGTIDWFYRIPKRQIELNINKYSSYVATVNKNDMYVIFNDNPKNEDKEADEKSDAVSRYKKSICVIQKIDKNKNVTKKELFNNEEVGKIFCPYDSKVLNENSILLYTDKYRDNDVILGKVVIE